MDKTRAKRADKAFARSIPLVLCEFNLRERVGVTLLLAQKLRVKSSSPQAKSIALFKKKYKMRTLRVAQTSPLDVHRRFSHVLKMNSQIRASSFARFRRVVGLSRVFHHGCFPRICVLRLCL